MYPCQPIYHYTSFTKQEYVQTLPQRTSSAENSNMNCAPSNFRELLVKIQKHKHQQSYRQLAVIIHNQYHLANRHDSLKRNATNLNEQSRVLQEKLTDKKRFSYINENHYVLK